MDSRRVKDVRPREQGTEDWSESAYKTRLRQGRIVEILGEAGAKEYDRNLDAFRKTWDRKPVDKSPYPVKKHPAGCESAGQRSSDAKRRPPVKRKSTESSDRTQDDSENSSPDKGGRAGRAIDQSKNPALLQLNPTL